MTRKWFIAEADRLRCRQQVMHKLVAAYEHKIEVIEAAAMHVQRHFRGIAARKRVLETRRHRSAIIQRSAPVSSAASGPEMLIVRFDWMHGFPVTGQINQDGTRDSNARVVR